MALWEVALRGVPWPPQTVGEVGTLAGAGLHMAGRAPLRMPGLAADAFRPLGAHLHGQSENLRRYVDGQLLIAAQATSTHANALYGAAALDMPRRGVAHVRGGIGKLAETLVDAVRRQGGQVLFRQRVTRVSATDGAKLVETSKGARFEADAVVFNLPPWDAAALLGEAAPARIRKAALPADGWGAFMVYVGLDGSILPADFPLHHQVLVREPLGEGNSVFLSLSLPDDAAAAPAGQRALTISTHTDLRTVVGAVRARSGCLRGAQGRVYRPGAGCCAGRHPGIAFGRPAGAARHAGHFPAFHAAQPRLGGRLPADQPVPSLGAATG